MDVAEGEAYCTLLMSDAYLPGAVVLAHSLRDNGTKKQLAVFVTLDNLHSSTIDELKKVYDHIIPVDRIVNRSPQNLYLMNRPDLASTFTKIALWRQTQFSHLVYLDADTVALRAPDELFKNPHSFAAVPDVGWPDCFNSGVLSLKPNMGDYYALLALAQRGISFDGADQGLLNMHFRNWERLSFTYNCTPSGNYQYVPAYRHFQSSISMVHFIGHDKPWKIGREPKSAAGVYEELLGRWWAVYDMHFRTPAAYASADILRQESAVQQYVTGEAANSDYGLTPAGKNSVAIMHSTEPPLAEDLQECEAKPVPTVEQRRFSVDWDPIHHAPPSNSRPEAANFPNEVYSMSQDPKLFQAPQNPEPPKDMYYEVPKFPPSSERPKPIFPWESTALKPTRVFADDRSAAPPETVPLIPDEEDTPNETESPPTPTVNSTKPESFASYQHSNAWDHIPEIERYISNLPQNRRARVQVLMNNTTTTATTDPQSQPEALASPSIESPQPRRPSMKLTDFPTEIERPSLPITPAPVHRPSFWGAERDAQGDLPGAEGVPDQSEWNPASKLEELQQRQKEVLAQNKPTTSSPGRTIPDRELPGSASAPFSEAGEERAASRPLDADMPPSFQTLDFSGGVPGPGVADEEKGRSAEVAPGEV